MIGELGTTNWRTVMANYTPRRNVIHRGRLALAVDCVLAGRNGRGAPGVGQTRFSLRAAEDIPATAEAIIAEQAHAREQLEHAI